MAAGQSSYCTREILTVRVLAVSPDCSACGCLVLLIVPEKQLIDGRSGRKEVHNRIQSIRREGWKRYEVDKGNQSESSRHQ